MIFGNVLITGSSRGLGLEFVRQLAPVCRSVIATCRSPENASDLNEIAAIHDTVTVKKLDVEKFDSFASFAEDLKTSHEQAL